MTDGPIFLSIKEICNHFGCGRTYAHAVKKSMENEGEFWPGNKMTLSGFIEWLRKHPDFNSNGYGRKKNKK